MSNQILEDLQWRYTTKKYDSAKRVSDEDLATIYEALRLSISSINSQPWKFVIIKSDSAKQRMYDTFEENFQFNQGHIFESSITILFAHKTHYTRDDYAKVVDKGIEDGRTLQEKREEAFGGFVFAELNTDTTGNTENWTKAQTYIALGSMLHTLARLKIDSTPMEGIDVARVNKEFAKELEGYQCDVALAVGYHHEEEDRNAELPKSRLSMESVVEVL